MMEIMIPPQVGMNIWTKKEKKREMPKKGQRKKEKKEKKMREKERRDNATLLLPQLCFKVAP